MFEGFTREYLQQEMSERGTSDGRPKRFIISTPVIAGMAIGGASLATAGITAAVVADREGQGVVEAEKLHRTDDIQICLTNNHKNLNLTSIIAKDLDNIRETEAWSSQSSIALSNAESSNDEVNHLFSRSGIFEFSDPRSEEYYTKIAQLNSKNRVGLTNAELKEMIRISADITSMVTSAISISGSSRKCEDMLLVKTMLTPILNHRSRLEISLIDGRFTHKYGNHSTYILISQDAVLSKQTRLFGHDINVVGRVCKIHNSINASSKSSPDKLFEIFKFEFEGTVTVT